ncbi:hypothetical protein [Pseudomonas sp. S37]|uniref:hypothetical protein n=1 Tax=Pseudomonas sp. S37 TaxID=2767449 RepID=UPI001912C2B8|nr:hypothetical protein [Pseudomonas sp. S37]
MNNSLYENPDAITGKTDREQAAENSELPYKDPIDCHLRQDSHSTKTLFFKGIDDSKVISIDSTAALTAPAFKENHHAHHP